MPAERIGGTSHLVATRRERFEARKRRERMRAIWRRPRWWYVP